MSADELADLSRRLDALERTVRRLCEAAGVTPDEPPAAARPPVPPPAAFPHVPDAPPAAVPQRSAEDLLGGRGLAVAGGASVLLGIVFFVALAIHRGLISVPLRMGLAALASGLLVAGAEGARRRGADRWLVGVLAVVGLLAGFATLGATIDDYHLLPDPSAALLGPAIAAVAVWSARRTGVQAVPVVGAAGVIAVPSLILGQGTAGLVYGVAAYVAACTVAVAGRWVGVWVVAPLAASPPLGGWIADAGMWPVVAVLAVFLATSVAAAVAGDVPWTRASGAAIHPAVVANLPVVTALAITFGLGAVDDASRGPAWWTTGVAAGLMAIGLAVALARPGRLVGRYVTALGFVVAAVAVALWLDGPGLVAGWAVQAVVGTWLARRSGDERAMVPAAGTAMAAAAAAVHLAPPDGLRAAVHGSAAATAAVLTVAAALGLMAWLVRAVPERLLPLGGRRAALVGAVAALAGLYGASFGLAQALGPGRQSTQVVLSGCWAVVGLTVIVAGLVRDIPRVRPVGLALLGLALLRLVLFDLRNLHSLSRAVSFLVVGLVALAGAYAYQRLRTRQDGAAPPA